MPTPALADPKIKSIFKLHFLFSLFVSLSCLEQPAADKAPRASHSDIFKIHMLSKKEWMPFTKSDFPGIQWGHNYCGKSEDDYEYCLKSRSFSYN